MVAGHLRIKDGNYHIVLSYNDENGKRKSTCRSTHLPVRGNKKRAEAMLQEARREMEETRSTVEENPALTKPGFLSRGSGL